jgi:voltage-gated potassium channel
MSCYSSCCCAFAAASLAQVNANVEQARAILALSEDDSYNAFVVLAAKEMYPAARTVVSVSNVGNTSRIMRVHPDVA